jgi:trk system potassium uptake protein TrkA
MRVVFVGASNLALVTATRLVDAGHEVVIIDADEEKLEDLEDDYDCSFVVGDGSRPSVLEDVDPASTDVLLCLSNSDTDNILAAVVAKSMEFDRVLLRLEDSELVAVCEQLELEHVIVPDHRVARELHSFVEGDGEPNDAQ